MKSVTQGFLQGININYEETYSHVMNTTTFRLLDFVVTKNLDMHLMDMIAPYLQDYCDFIKNFEL